ncbi:hypothetical protein Tco_0595006 [Tanacetum coccineum]
MEVYTMMMEINVQASPRCKYHFGYKDLMLTHICFANDLLVLSHGDENSVKTIKRTLEEFNNASRLGLADCKQLVDKVKNVILDWKNKALSYAGRL